MSWFKETKRTWTERLAINALQAGPVPRHVAFIMDGNRRFAKKLNVENRLGHVAGFEKLAQVGVESVTIRRVL